MDVGISNGNIELQGEEIPVRGLHNLVEFEERYRETRAKESCSSNFLNMLSKQKARLNLKRWCLELFPFIGTLRNYKISEDLPNDMIAGITAGVMMIPQGMAFAALSTLPPIVGLYISFFASLTYFTLGTGRQLSWGCIAILSLMMASILDKYDEKMSGGSTVCTNTSEPTVSYSSNGTRAEAMNGSDLSSVVILSQQDSGISSEIMSKRLEVASAVSVASGLILFLASRIGLSRITCLMSNSLITGFTVGISFHVVTSQVKGILGLSIPRTTGYATVIKTWILIFSKLPETNIATLLISIVSILVIYLIKKFVNEKFKNKLRVPIPIELFVVIIATFISNYAHFHQKFNVTVVEDVPMGIPAPKFPDLSLATDYIGDGLIIIIIAYAQTLAMAKTMGLKHNYVVDSNQEMLACGIVSVICGLFSGYISASSVSRTVVQDGAGGKTQVASLFASAMVLLVILVLGQYFYYLPTCVLSSIIVVNLRTMFLKLFVLPQEWATSKYDCAVWLFACFSTIILNADIGLLASIAFSLVLVIVRSMVSPVSEAGQIHTGPEKSLLRSTEHYPAAVAQEWIKIVKVKTPLYFANADVFVNSVFRKTGIDPTTLQKKKENQMKTKEPSTTSTAGEQNKREDSTNMKMLFNCATETDIVCVSEVRSIVLDVSEVSFVDLMGVQALEFVIMEFASVGVKVLVCGVSESILAMLQSTGFWKKHGASLFLTYESAIASLE